MLVHRHAEAALVAMQGRLPLPASVYLARLRQMETEPNEHIALEVARLQYAHGSRDRGTNGDMVVAIIREQQVITVMLRRSWNQAFTPEVLRVDRVMSWEGAAA